MSENEAQRPGAHPRPAPEIHPQPPGPSAAGPKRSELTARLFTASFLVPAIVFIIVQGGLWVLGSIIVLTLLGLREFYGLIEEKGAHPLVGFGLVAGAALPVVAYVGNEYHATLLMTAVLLCVMVVQLTKAEITEAMASISGTFFGIFYVGWLLSHAVVLRGFYRAAVAKWPAVRDLGLAPDVGVFVGFFAVATVALCDAGAYFAGRAYGVHKLAPRISPGKSIEGAMGGILTGMAGGLATKGVFDFFWPQLSRILSWKAALLFSFTVAVVAIIGDLVESLLKRDAKRKDAGALLPGVGGVLDRIDSSLLGIPVMYYMLLGYLYLQVGAP